MKKRMVEVEEGEELSEKRFEKLYSHARNSGIWYAQNLPKTTHELKKKLYEKGYPKGTVFVTSELEGRREVNIVDTAVASLVDAYYVDDEDVAQRFAESRKRRGNGRMKTSQELRRKGLEEDLVEAILDDVYGGEGVPEELRKLLANAHRIEAPRATDEWKLRQKLLRRGASRGWDLGLVSEVVEDLMAPEDS